MIDAYELKARQAPIFIVILPALVTFFSIFPDLRSVAGYLGGLFSIFGVQVLLSKLARVPGKMKEKQLFELWGGKPTTYLLRHSNNVINKTTKKSYHDCLRSSSEGFNIPTIDEENNNPTEADNQYEAAVDWLRSKTRNKEKYSLVMAENTSYGFARNLWGMKPLAIVILVISLLLISVVIIAKHNSGEVVSSYVITMLILMLIDLFMWINVISPEWVKVYAESYAKALLETICAHN